MTQPTGLRYGSIGVKALHVAVDMQRLFAEPTEWFTPTLNAITPAVAWIAAQHPENTLFTRFITPFSPEQASGAWRRYYRRWRSLTLERMDSALLGLVTPLRRFVPPATVVDKTTHSAFESAAFRKILDQRRPDTLIFTGVETDVCVLASVMTAVDRNYRVVVVADAVTSSSSAGHQATLETIFPRFDQQIETVIAKDLLAAWPC